MRNRIYRLPIDSDIHNTEQSFDLDKMIPLVFARIVSFPDRVKAGFYFSDSTLVGNEFKIKENIKLRN